MSKTDKTEIGGRVAELEDAADVAIEDTETEMDHGNEAISVFSGQSDPILEETASELNSVRDSLGNTIVSEVEEKAAVVDEKTSIEQEYETELGDDASIEDEAAKTIRSGSSNVANDAMQAELEGAAEGRQEGEEFLTSQQQELESERLSDEQEVTQQRDQTKSAADAIRSF